MSSTVPASGRSKPAITRSVVVLPEPDGPNIVKNSPTRISRSRSSIATTSPNARRTPRSVTAGSAAKCFVEDRKALLELLVGRRERRQQANDVAVQAAGQEDQAPLARGRRDGARRVAVLLDELEREHRSEPPHLADDARMLGGDCVEAVAQQARDLLGALA